MHTQIEFLKLQEYEESEEAIEKFKGKISKEIEIIDTKIIGSKILKVYFIDKVN